ncbi:MAG: enoyl-CoA hydratase-related protein, partial [Actinomycetota bacterium]|nr:enoyl-CoA hydratase-related protein [Actinomycetota bacterium]
MSEEVIRIENVDRVRVVTIDRPQALNSMNNAVFGGIRDALAGAEADNDVAVAMITGEGRAFSAGQDLQEMQDGVAAGDG